MKNTYSNKFFLLLILIGAMPSCLLGSWWPFASRAAAPTEIILPKEIITKIIDYLPNTLAAFPFQRFEAQIKQIQWKDYKSLNHIKIYRRKEGATILEKGFFETGTDTIKRIIKEIFLSSIISFSLVNKEYNKTLGDKRKVLLTQLRKIWWENIPTFELSFIMNDMEYYNKHTNNQEGSTLKIKRACYYVDPEVDLGLTLYNETTNSVEHFFSLYLLGNCIDLNYKTGPLLINTFLNNLSLPLKTYFVKKLLLYITKKYFEPKNIFFIVYFIDCLLKQKQIIFSNTSREALKNTIKQLLSKENPNTMSIDWAIFTGAAPSLYHTSMGLKGPIQNHFNKFMIVTDQDYPELTPQQKKLLNLIVWPPKPPQENRYHRCYRLIKNKAEQLLLTFQTYFYTIKTYISNIRMLYTITFRIERV